MIRREPGGSISAMSEAFSGAAMALTAAVTDPAAVAPLTAVEIDCAAPDVELLLAEWLNALVYEMSNVVQPFPAPHQRRPVAGNRLGRAGGA
jgi:hypothetical protein